MREGNRCAPREVCLDFLDGGSIILNKLDVHWPPVGRLCAALRKHFLHVFAVMYLTPRGSRAVPVHTDDQDVFILQLAGRKSWSVYGSPVELPYSHEQRGKGVPIDRTALGPPLLEAELVPGSVLYIPRGFAHEARATEGGASLHITLTVQTSDLNWCNFINEGLVGLHRTHEEARTPLPLDAAIGGYGADTIALDAHGGIIDGVYLDSAERSEPTAARELSASGAAGDHGVAPPSMTSAQGSVQGSAQGSAQIVRALIGATECERSRAFDLAMDALANKLNVLNNAQDAAVAAGEAPGSAALRGSALPPLLRCPPGVSMAVRAVPAHGDHVEALGPSPSAGARAGATQLELVCSKQNGSLTTKHASRFHDALAFIADAARTGTAFRPADLPGSDAFEQVALCSRLLSLQALVDGGPL